MTPASPLVEGAQAALVAAGLSLPRMLAFMVLVPVFSSATFPRTVRIAVALGLASPVAAGVFHQVWMLPLPQDAVLIVLKEVVIGLVLGFPVAAPLWTLQSVGAVIDNQRGANAAQMVTPFAQADASVLGGAFMQAMVVLLYSTGAFTLIYSLLLQSYEVWPVLQLSPDLAQFGFDASTGRLDEFMYRTLLLAAPVIAITLLVDFVFALMGVFAPQLQTYFAAIPVKSLAALAVLAVYLAILMGHGEGQFRDMIRRESNLLQGTSR